MYSFTELARSAQCAFDRLRATEVCTSLRRAGMLLCSAVPDCTKIPKCSARHHYLRRAWGPAVWFDPCMRFPGARCECSLRFPCPFPACPLAQEPPAGLSSAPAVVGSGASWRALR